MHCIHPKLSCWFVSYLLHPSFSKTSTHYDFFFSYTFTYFSNLTLPPSTISIHKVVHILGLSYGIAVEATGSCVERKARDVNRSKQRSPKRRYMKEQMANTLDDTI
mmetsp:Transcript_7305/g.16162  ORF Transcript_7305/g.16162 Transcript_7305/m.16162 type:complete len:106 (+) Transcript_7305:291-608(+)